MDESYTNEILNEREREVRKSNELIQKSRYQMTAQEQKFVLFILSMINYSDKEFREIETTITEFCSLCGIENGGHERKIVKDTIKKIADRSVWVREGNKEILLRWIEKPTIFDDGTIKIKLCDDMKPYLLQLKQNYSRYNLIYALNFSTKYAIRFYELLVSLHYDKTQDYVFTIDIDELRKNLGAENYTDFKDFKKRVLIPAIKEINTSSDKNVDAYAIKSGRKVQKIRLYISQKNIDEYMKMREHVENNLGTLGEEPIFETANKIAGITNKKEGKINE